MTSQSIYTECVNLSPDHVAWLDEIREKGWWVDEKEGKGIELPQESFLSQDDFKTPLNELIK